MAAQSRRTSADLLSLGQQCSLPDCQQNDFLPFRCDACEKVFCLEHRTCKAHTCPNGDRDASVIICPLCAKGIRMLPQEDPDSAFDRHTASVRPLPFQFSLRVIAYASKHTNFLGSAELRPQQLRQSAQEEKVPGRWVPGKTSFDKHFPVQVVPQRSLPEASFPDRSQLQTESR